MVVWLWIGGAVMAFGTALAAFPGRRRRDPLQPASAPLPAGADDLVDDVPMDDRTPEPVEVGA